MSMTKEQEITRDLVLEEIARRLRNFDDYPFGFTDHGIGSVSRSEVFHAIAKAILAEGKSGSES